MSPRIRVLRKVSNPPLIKGFKPYGIASELGTEEVKLLYEEYEALRLCDYDMLNHYQASVMMGVSRPTFTRIYASALQKIAKAFIEGRQISIEGGKVYFDSEWYHCTSCGCYFNNPEKEKEVDTCPLCKSGQIIKPDNKDIEEDKAVKEFEDVCVCPDCGYEEVHKPGEPCGKNVCPRCHSYMKRKGSPYCRNFNNR
jgi:predicted DNA-binding protein (UPF0251 family)/DNA-directed RNA polymerase subunit RPC12/RpoP